MQSRILCVSYGTNPICYSTNNIRSVSLHIQAVSLQILNQFDAVCFASLCFPMLSERDITIISAVHIHSKVGSFPRGTWVLFEHWGGGGKGVPLYGCVIRGFTAIWVFSPILVYPYWCISQDSPNSRDWAPEPPRGYFIHGRGLPFSPIPRWVWVYILIPFTEWAHNAHSVLTEESKNAHYVPNL